MSSMTLQHVDTSLTPNRAPPQVVVTCSLRHSDGHIPSSTPRPPYSLSALKLKNI